MSIQDLLSHYRTPIVTRLSSIWNEKLAQFESVNRWGEDVLTRLEPFIFGGKMVRGGLIMHTARNLGGESAMEQALIASCAIESIHSGILIRDDIADNDLLRRGLPAIHAQYRKDWDIHTADALAICAGDIALFIGNELLSQISPASIARRFHAELQLVGLAQMDDIVHADTMQESDILSIYRYKTARYTFSLPFFIGASIAGIDEDTAQILTEIGDDIGIVFQIQDDLIGLMQPSTQSGKPRGSDVRENKMTLYKRMFMNYLAGHPEFESELNYFGRGDLSDADLDHLTSVFEKTGVFEQLQARMNHHTDRALSRIRLLEIPDAFRADLFSLTTYVRERKA